jgi:tetratricopeptide (TPR) repeat protein
VPAKTEAYVGERIPLTVKLYLGGTRVEQLQFPKIGGQDFVLAQLPQPVERQEVQGGVRYRVLIFETSLTPLRAGELTVGPATMDMVQLVSRRRRDMFDGFFDDMFADRQPLEAQGQAVKVSVLPLPEEGKPDGFGGAVGRFDFTVEVKPTELNVGDPITVRMGISGDGDLGAVGVPRIPVDDRFRPYDPLPVKGEEGAGRRVFEQVVIPKDPAVTALPAVSFSFFDPQSRAYRTLTRGPVALTVHGAPASTAPVAPQVLLPQEEARPEPTPEKLGRDIVYIKGAPGRLRRAGSGSEWAWWFLILQLLPLAGFAVLAAHASRRERFRADPRLLRFRQAGREARRTLTALSRRGERESGFYDELTATVQGYLGAKLDLPPGAVDREQVCARLNGAGGADELRREVTAFFELLDRVRYGARNALECEPAEALRLAKSIVDRMERERTLASRFGTNLPGAVVVLGLLVGVVTAGPGVAGVTDRLDPVATFYEGNAAYSADRYRDAIAAYQRVVDGGQVSGAVYFNLGNAYFKNRQLGEAIVNYERARRLLPRDPDVSANLAYARELVDDAGWALPLWRQVLFPLETRATTTELEAACVILWWALWTTLAVRLFLHRQRAALSRAAVMLGLIVAFVSANFGARVAAIEWGRAAVVVAAGPVAVRFEPSDRGTEHFQVGEGVLLEVADERDGWLQVRRSDGRRGWIPSAAVDVI